LHSHNWFATRGSWKAFPKFHFHQYSANFASHFQQSHIIRRSDQYSRKSLDRRIASQVVDMPIPTGSSSESPSTSSMPTADPPLSGRESSQLEISNEPETKSEAEEAADRLYEERIEEEYAKREGGA
jgi:hypothetical protein